MAKIIISESDLGKRGQQVTKMLRPILGDRHGSALSYSTLPKQNQEFFIVARDKESTSDFLSWRFATFHKEFRANYYETWIPADRKGHQKWCLAKAYLHIYRIDRIAVVEKEYLALHADPQEPDGPLAIYKRNPHLHIKASDHPIPKAHIAITVGSMREVLVSSQTLFGAMKHGIELIRDEILSRY